MAENEVRPAPVPVPRASEVMQKLASGSSAEPPSSDKSAPAAAVASTPGATPSGSSDATSSGGTTPPAGQDAAPTDADGRLARLAKETRRLEKEREAWKAEQATKLDAASKWERLQEAKTKGGRVAALESLFDAGEIEGELYTELTERIYAKGDGAAGLTKADADKLVAEKLAAARKADEDARAKAATDAQAAADAEAAQVRGEYLDAVNRDWEANKGKFPSLAAVLEDLPSAVTGPDILKFTEGHFKEHGKAPQPEEIFGYFEAKLAKRFKPAAETTTTAPAGARALPRGDAPVRPDRTKSIKEAWEETKKNLGIV